MERSGLWALAVVGALLVAGLAAAAEKPAPGEAPAFPRGELVEGIECVNDPTQTYTLYLPSAYSVERRWPVLFIFDPRGRSVHAAEIFRDAAERYGWILMSSDNTRSDGPWDPNFKAVAAMWPEVERFAYDSKRTYATGFSGGAMLAWLVGQQTRELAGVIGSGGRPIDPSQPDREVPFAFFGAAGDAEFNYWPTRELVETAARLGALHRFEAFEGPHRWLPPELAREAVEWMELVAMRAGSRPRDEDLTAELYEQDLARARELEAAGDLLAAQRRYDAVARTFAGLRDVESPRAKAEELAASKEYRKAFDQESAARQFEESRRRRIDQVIGVFRLPGATANADRLAIDLRLSSLQKTAEEETPKGMAARRVLSSLRAYVAFYQPRELFAEKDYLRAAAVLEIATRIDPGNPIVWYNLASAQAQTGRRKDAIDSLARAVDNGYADLAHLEQDTDLDPLRDHPGYAEIVARLRG